MKHIWKVFNLKMFKLTEITLKIIQGNGIFEVHIIVICCIQGGPKCLPVR